MPVIKACWNKFRELNLDFDDEKYLYVTENIFAPDFCLSEFMESDIESIYSRVVEFIKWYNNK